MRSLLPLATALTAACLGRTPPRVVEPAAPHSRPPVDVVAEVPQPSPLPSPSPGRTLSARTFGDRCGSHMAHAFTVDRRGDVVVVGSVQGGSLLGRDGGSGPCPAPTAYDGFVAKLDRDGVPIWSRVLGGSGSDIAHDVAVDDDGNVYVAGTFASPTIDLGGGPLRCAGVHDFFLLKLDAEGRHVWSKRIGDREDQFLLQLEVDEGGLVVSGHFRGAVNFGGRTFTSYPDKAIFVARLDLDGKHLWSDSFGHLADYAATDTIRLDDGTTLLSAGSSEIGKGKPKKNDLGIVLRRYDRAGKLLSHARFGGGADNLETHLAKDPAGGFVLAANFPGDVDLGGGILRKDDGDLVLARFDVDGKHVFSKRPRAASRWASLSGVIVAGDEIVATGSFERHWTPAPEPSFDVGTGPMILAGRRDSFVAAFDREGAARWSVHHSGDGAWIGPVGVASAPGTLVVVGSVTGEIDLGGVTLRSAAPNRRDLFVANLAR
jgi:hypothetical protein